MTTRKASVAGIALTLCAPMMLCFVGLAHAQSASESAAGARTENGVPISDLIATVAKKTGKKFVLDPRVRSDIILVGQDPAGVSYNDLLNILAIYDYIAIETSGYVDILPEANARQVRTPMLSGKESFPDAEIVSVVITPKSIPAAQLVPILRPLIPQYGHLAAMPCVNKLILVDRFANVKRLEAIIDALDVGEPYKMEKCEYSPSSPASK
jgi:type II secretory pathway component GspD/PulD (secretin)